MFPLNHYFWKIAQKLCSLVWVINVCLFVDLSFFVLFLWGVFDFCDMSFNTWTIWKTYILINFCHNLSSTIYSGWSIIHLILVSMLILFPNTKIQIIHILGNPIWDMMIPKLDTGLDMRKWYQPKIELK